MREEILEQLLFGEVKVVFKYLIKIGAPREDAEDIIQETLYKTIKNIDAIDEDKVRAWLFKVAINSYYSQYKMNKKQSNFLANDLQSLEVFTGSPEDYFIMVLGFIPWESR